MLGYSEGGLGYWPGPPPGSILGICRILKKGPGLGGTFLLLYFKLTWLGLASLREGPAAVPAYGGCSLTAYCTVNPVTVTGLSMPLPPHPQGPKKIIHVRGVFFCRASQKAPPRKCKNNAKRYLRSGTDATSGQNRGSGARNRRLRYRARLGSKSGFYGRHGPWGTWSIVGTPGIADNTA